MAMLTNQVYLMASRAGGKHEGAEGKPGLAMIMACDPCTVSSLHPAEPLQAVQTQMLPPGILMPGRCLDVAW